MGSDRFAHAPEERHRALYHAGDVLAPACHQPTRMRRCEISAPAYVSFGSDSVIRRCRLRCSVCPKADWVGGAFLAGGDAAALTKAITATAAQFFVEVAAKGDKQEALKRSGLTYLLRLRQFHDSRS